MVSGQGTSGRGKKLHEAFGRYITGKLFIESIRDASHFLEAADIICREKSPAFFVESVVASSNGVEVIRNSVRCDLSPNFVSSVVTRLIKHLADPAVKSISNGAFLQSILVNILHPPTFWSALLKYSQETNFNNGNSEAFAWLCLEVVSMRCPETTVPFDDVAALAERKVLHQPGPVIVRQLAYRIDKVLRLHLIDGNDDASHGPGGRHDNDFLNFRDIAVFPTADEIRSCEGPFLQRLDDVFQHSRESRPAEYLSWLFRLLREDMLGNLRKDLAVAWGQKTGPRKPLSLGRLRLSGVGNGNDRRPDSLALKMVCDSGLVFHRRLIGKDARKRFLEDSKSYLKHGSFGALCCGHDVVAFGSLVRNVDLLLANPPMIVVKFADVAALRLALQAFLGHKKDDLRFIVVDTPTFAYQPILQRLTEIKEIPLEEVLLEPTFAATPPQSTPQMSALLTGLREALRTDQEFDLCDAIDTKRPIHVSGAQLESLINGLENCIGQIQGPPGTGKSFIGALIVAIILKFTEYRVLVLTYTNHALDQFLEDLLDIGVSGDNMVRLGSKFTPKTANIRLDELAKQPQHRFSHKINSVIRQTREESSDVHGRLAEAGSKLLASVTLDDVLAMLEFSDEWTSFWAAFQVPEQVEGFAVVGKKNKLLLPVNILDMWIRGKIPSKSVEALLASNWRRLQSVWHIPIQSRGDLVNQWTSQVRREQIQEFVELAALSDTMRLQIESLYNESKRKVLREKRIIGCTTTAAAMYQSLIESAKPDVILGEEAAEILEAHIITALSSSVKQLVLIGDHKQLRPKVSNYELTVEKGDGFNLNMSLFERLISQGHSHTTLREQHRSHPEISFFSRRLAYEHLVDGAECLRRPEVKGLRGRVIFVHHEHHEDKLSEVPDPQGGLSRRNTFEAMMVLKMVKYLGQQGYQSKDMVVLTPYLGQLSLLRQQLSREHDPWLDDLDTHELTRLGLLSEAAAKVNKKTLRLSTIDNYQGEESDIVVASLTRSNDHGDIGFMSARERLVVLMSRARNSIILFGNMHTFTKSKKGGELWKDFFQALKERNCLFDGVPVFCERHPERAALLRTAEDFERLCPDGGCAEPCGATLSCGKHACEHRCHLVMDHSRAPCRKEVQQICERGHQSNVMCSAKEAGCKTCAREDEEVRRRAAQNLQLERLRLERQVAYAQALQKIEVEIDHIECREAYEGEEAAQKAQLAEKQAKLEDLKAARKRREAATKLRDQERSTQHRSKSDSAKVAPKSGSQARTEWELLKQQGDFTNRALDELMDMIGLESVKEEFLSIKSNIDVKIRQGVSLAEERLGCCLLGNPGSGKTTVARLWGEFLAWTGACPGSGFEETSGSKLANIGVSGCEKLLDKLKKESHGGVLFIDEAYQLSSGNSPGGKAVLDFLLAEVENLRGKICFVIAGYNKQMETFFSHNPGFASRFPIKMTFDDYSDEGLLLILERQVNRRFGGRMTIEGGMNGLFPRIVARRTGRGRGKEGFGNARAVENALALIEKRQSVRLRRERQADCPTDDFLLTKEDLLGPEPSSALKDCEAWRKMNEMIGLGKVKQEVKILLDSLVTNYQRELDEKPLMSFALNRVFIGSPGTGKTTVAKLYGQILASLGMLSNGEVVVKTPADFIGSALGQSEAQTKGILASTVGKVLVIDEAYGLQGASDSSVADPYRTAVVDTIVAEVQNVPGEDRCVILLGYKEQMEEMFRNVNPGLSRRFAVDNPFIFEDFDDGALSQILELKLQAGGMSASEQAKRTALEVLVRERRRPNFGNAGAIDNLLSKAKAGYQKRMSAGKATDSQLEAVDFDEDFDRSSATDINQLFAGDLGREAIIAMLQKTQEQVRQLRSLNMDVTDVIPFNFLFKGPPGTGKTTTARKMGQVYYDMGFLSAAEVIECSASDLIAKYSGHTSPQVRQLLEKGLGKVLFIDEAYRLAGQGFAKEAVDELVDSITKDRYKCKLIIILAGYSKDVDDLLSVNPGLSSRFPETVYFEPLSAENCLRLLTSLLAKKKKDVEARGKQLDLSCLLPPSGSFEKTMLDLFESLGRIDGWANARDVEQIAKAIFRSVDLTADFLSVEEHQVIGATQEMLQELSRRAQSQELSDVCSNETTAFPLELRVQPPMAAPPATSTQVEEIDAVEEEQMEQSLAEPDVVAQTIPALGTRDAGLSDEVWEQLVRDHAAEQQRETEYQRLQEAHRSASDANKERIVRQLLEEDRRRREEAAKKAKLMALGACPAGFHWIKQTVGYRCAGGSHFMPNARVDSL